MLITLTYSRNLTLAAVIGVGLFMLGYWLIPFYASRRMIFSWQAC